MHQGTLKEHSTAQGDIQLLKETCIKEHSRNLNSHRGTFKEETSRARIRDDASPRWMAQTAWKGKVRESRHRNQPTYLHVALEARGS